MYREVVTRPSKIRSGNRLFDALFSTKFEPMIVYKLELPNGNSETEWHDPERPALTCALM